MKRFGVDRRGSLVVKAIVVALCAAGGLYSQRSAVVHVQPGPRQIFQGFGGAQFEGNIWNSLSQGQQTSLAEAIWGEEGLNANILKLWTSQWENNLDTVLQQYEETAKDVLAVRPDVMIITSGNTSEKIPDSDLPRWAEHIGAIIQGLEEHGIPIYAAGIFNEPNAYAKLTDPGVPKCVKLFRQEFDKRGLEDVKIIAPECSMVDDGCVSMIEALVNDKEALGIIDGFATHCYNMCLRKYITDIEWPHGKNHWQTESSHSGYQIAFYFLGDLNLGNTHWVHFFAFWAERPSAQYGIMDFDGTKYPQYNYYKQLMQTFPYGTQVRICSSDLESWDDRGEWMENTYGDQVAFNAAAGVGPDGKLGIAIVNHSGTTYDVMFAVDELVEKGGLDEMTMHRVTDNGGIAQLQDVVLDNGYVSVTVHDKEMVALRTKGQVDMTVPAAYTPLPQRHGRIGFTVEQVSPHGAAFVVDVPRGAAGGHVALAVYGADGRLVKSITGDAMTPGRHRIVWSGDNEHGARVAPGVYMVRMDTCLAARWARLVVK